MKNMKLGSLLRRLPESLGRREAQQKDSRTHIEQAVAWLCEAQDSQSHGGVSLRYSLVDGWSPAYPETTGYIIPTFLRLASPENGLRRRALAMADWELSIQKEDGSFRGGPIGSGYDSFVFDTGQILFGLLAAYEETKDEKYLNAALRAGDWLVRVQDASGAWVRYTFHSIPHVYYTRVAWALAELGEMTNRRVFAEAADRHVRWAVAKQQPNGWFEMAGFTERGHLSPYTHTIAYTIEGVLETGARLRRDEYVEAARRAAEALVKLIGDDGYLAGTFDRHWKTTARYSCLTGNAQISLILSRLYEIFRDGRYLQASGKLNAFLRAHQDTGPEPELRGAIAGSWPLWGRYQRLAYPNWAAKFFIDSQLLEQTLAKKGEEASAPVSGPGIAPSVAEPPSS